MVTLNPGKKEAIFKFSGGHAGLIVAIFKNLLERTLPRTEVAQIGHLLAYDSIAGECRKIWNSLEAQEQDTLNQLVNSTVSVDSPLQLGSLVSKGVIIKDEQGQISIFSPLFQAFLQTTFEPDESEAAL